MICKVIAGKAPNNRFKLNFFVRCRSKKINLAKTLERTMDSIEFKFYQNQ